MRQATKEEGMGKRSKEQAGAGGTAYNPILGRLRQEDSKVRQPGKLMETLSHRSKGRLWDVAQFTKCLPSMHEALC